MMPPNCPCLAQRPDALTLGNNFATDFGTRTNRLGHGEIVLFRAMRDSLKSVARPRHVTVEEYHGSGHQVTFSGSGTYSRNRARCELSDLLVIVFDPQTKDARLSYIQAKSERTARANQNGVAGQRLASNLEQWDLLARRPSIAGVGSFNPPQDLLQSAWLDSIGSFAFFLHTSAGVQIAYSTAKDLQPRRQQRSRYGRLLAPPDTCRCRPTPECRSVYGNAEFGAFLFGMLIGTPILAQGKPAWGPSSWLAAQLRGFSQQALEANADATLATTLSGLLDPDDGPAASQPNVGAESLLIFSSVDMESRIARDGRRYP